MVNDRLELLGFKVNSKMCDTGVIHCSFKLNVCFGVSMHKKVVQGGFWTTSILLETSIIIVFHQILLDICDCKYKCISWSSTLSRIWRRVLFVTLKTKLGFYHPCLNSRSMHLQSCSQLAYVKNLRMNKLLYIELRLPNLFK